MKENNIKIIDEVNFTGKAIGKVEIGDPYYFENNEGLHLTASKNCAKTGKKTYACIRSIDEPYEFDGKTYISKQIKSIISCLDENAKVIHEAHTKSMYIPALLKKETELGCDTACFDITFDKKVIEIRTLSDGYYGMFFDYGQKGWVFESNITQDALSLKDMENNIRYLLKDEKEQKKDR